VRTRGSHELASLGGRQAPPDSPRDERHGERATSEKAHGA
jgi:hypothetical protein